jgi:hypothetical protein
MAHTINKFMEQDKGMRSTQRATWTLQKNAIAERAHSVGKSHTRAMMVHSQTPEFLWSDATVYSQPIRNRAMNKVLHTSVGTGETCKGGDKR